MFKESLGNEATRLRIWELLRVFECFSNFFIRPNDFRRNGIRRNGIRRSDESAKWLHAHGVRSRKTFVGALLEAIYRSEDVNL